MNKIFISLILLACSFSAHASVKITDAWVRATAPGQEVGGAYMTITSKIDSTLTSASSPIASDVQIHRMWMEKDVMKMRRLDSLLLPKGKPVKLGPDGFHLMLFGLKKPLKEGDNIEFSLTLKDKLGNQTVQIVRVPVKSN
jgi:copper(I)-binding protein